MRDALGGTVVLTIIVVFIVFVLSYLAFNVNYTKTFRMKDKIVSCYNKCSSKKNNPDKNCVTECNDEIASYAKTIGYEQGIQCPTNWVSENYYCYKEVIVTKEAEGTVLTEKGRNKKYYRIITKINIDLPIIKKIFDYGWFSIEGQTNAYTTD